MQWSFNTNCYSLLLLLVLPTCVFSSGGDNGGDSFRQMMAKVKTADGFFAALDQSGGSTPKALKLYGIPDNEYVVGEESMYDAIHEMRTRVITSKSFTGDRVVGAILFEDTMNRDVDGVPTSQYLWEQKNIVPFLKCDKGLEDEADGVQLMKPMPNLDDLLERAKQKGVFGTKMRSLIKSNNAKGIQAVVDQQFEVGSQIIKHGLIPIIEPEVDITSPQKAECEELLKSCLLESLNKLGDDECVMLKLSLPSKVNLYRECIEHPRCLRAVALSGGYSRTEANVILAQQAEMVASFSRALTEGLSHTQGQEEFDKLLEEATTAIYEASKAGLR